MTILVTGGAGFIGSVLIAALNKRGIDDIFIVDHLSNTEKYKNLRRLRFADYFEKSDFLSYLDAGKLLGHNFDAVFHLGACSSTTERDCGYLIKNNYEFSKAIASFAHKNGIRFIYASSAATYGGGEHGFNDDNEQIEKLIPLNMYGYSKHMFDLWLKRRGLLEHSVGLKFFNVFGPNEYHKGDMKSFVVKAFEQINSNGEVKLFKSHRSDYKDGEQLRDFIYVKDAVEMALHFLNCGAAGLFNIATGTARSFNDLVKATFAALNKPVKISYIDMPISIRGQYQYYTCGNIGKIKLNGYTKSTYTLEDAVKNYVQGYLIKHEYAGFE